MSNDEALYKALENILDIVVPERVNLADVKDHITGYKKQKAIETILNRARADPLFTKLKLHMIYVELRQLANNGGLL